MPESLLTIVFRGLMIFHQQGNALEVGVLPTAHAPNHFLRIYTIRNGLVDGITPIDPVLVGNSDRHWNIQVTGPVGSGARRFTDGSATLDRKDDDNTHAQDFRWVMDIESAEFFGPLGTKIDTSVLRPVFKIPNGRIYNRLKSRRMNRLINGTGSAPFGRVSEAVACDIRLTGPRAQLVPEGGVPIFNFDAEDNNVIYEIANTPPDRIVPPPPQFEDHFEHYYHILDGTLPRFSFALDTTITAPSPALCGTVFLGNRNTEL